MLPPAAAARTPMTPCSPEIKRLRAELEQLRAELLAASGEDPPRAGPGGPFGLLAGSSRSGDACAVRRASGRDVIRVEGAPGDSDPLGGPAMSFTSTLSPERMPCSLSSPS